MLPSFKIIYLYVSLGICTYTRMCTCVLLYVWVRSEGGTGHWTGHWAGLFSTYSFEAGSPLLNLQLGFSLLGLKSVSLGGPVSFHVPSGLGLQVCVGCQLLLQLSRGSGTWENGADKWGRLKSYAICSYLLGLKSCDFIDFFFFYSHMGKFSRVQVISNHKDKHMTNKFYPRST